MSVWAKPFPASAAQAIAAGLEFDVTTQHLLMVGRAQGTVDFGGPTSPVPAGLFVAAFDDNGAPVWVASCGGGSTDGSGIAVGHGGHIAVIGSIQGSATCGTQSVSSVSPSAQSILIVTLDGSGNALLAQAWGDTSSSPSSQGEPRLTAATDGKLWLAWVASGKVRVGMGAQTTVLSQVNEKLAIASLDSSGLNPLVRFYGDGQQEIGSLTTDSARNLLLIGTNHGTIDLGSGALSATNGGEILVGSWDEHFAPGWSTQYGSDSRCRRR